MNKRKVDSNKITIIVPCYNVEKYLDRCVKSILNQTNQNFEVILIEDCSTDSTKEIVERYTRENPGKIRAIYNKTNQGLGENRNIGLRDTKTDIVTFIDSDDWFQLNFLEKMLDTLIKGSVDVAICDITLSFDDVSRNIRVKAFKNRADKFGFINTGMIASSNNKLFKKKVFDGLEFVKGLNNEDIPTIIPIVNKFKIAYCGNTFYNYSQREGSIQNSDITEKRFDAFSVVDIARQRMEKDKVSREIWDAIVYHQLMILLLFVIPKQTNLIKRKKLIVGFYERIVSYNPIDNFCYKEYLYSVSLPVRRYADRLYKSLMARKFNKVNRMMSIANGANRVLDSRLIKISRFFICHPRSALRIAKNRFIHGNVIKNAALDIESVVLAAEVQKNKKDSKNLSVIIPNYNYESFMYQRIYSILNQTAKIGEIIVLDDVSTDGSVALIRDIIDRIKSFVDIRLVVNKDNQGVFRQWEKGFDMAKYEYVWIAEADDYSEKDFLVNTLKPLDADENVVVSYVNTAYITGDGWFINSVKNDIDIQKSGHWNKSYVNAGIDEIRKYSFLNNTIANVSSAVFRKKSDINYKKLFAVARDYKQAGDWIFYTNYMTYGDVAYTNKTLNYYRMHGNNVSSTIKKEAHLNEIRKIHNSFVKKYNLDQWHINKMSVRRDLLKKTWKI